LQAAGVHRHLIDEVGAERSPPLRYLEVDSASLVGVPEPY
jgi:hypothetical protein